MDERFECCRYRPSLDDLLADAVMEPVLRSAGLDPHELREMMAQTARRIEDRDRHNEDGSDSGRGIANRRRNHAEGGAAKAGNSSRTFKPGWLSASATVPWWRRATARTRLRPSPLPGVLRLPSRRTKRSNTASRRSARECRARYRRLRAGAPVRPGTRRTERSPAAGVFERVVEQIGDRLRQQMAVAAHRTLGLGLERQGEAVFLGHRLVELGDGARDLGEIERPGLVAARAGLGLGDAEQRVEGAEQPVGLVDRVAQRLA